MAHTLPLVVGDSVSVLARVLYGDLGARLMANDRGQSTEWDTVRIDGSVESCGANNLYKLKLIGPDGKEIVSPLMWRRQDILLVSRNGKTVIEMEQAVRDAVARAVAAAHGGQPREQAAAAATAAAEPAEADIESVDSEADAAERMAEPEAEQGVDNAAEDGWIRDDHANVSQRALDGVNHQELPVLLGLEDVKSTNLFDLGVHILPKQYIIDLAKLMTKNGKTRSTKNPDYKFWNLEVNDVYQWIGVWLYILAHFSPGPRSQYFTAVPGEPQHFIPELLAKGDPTKHKGEKWFNMMNACFELPTERVSPGEAERDPFHRVRAFWNALRERFRDVLRAGHYLCLDESMVKWVGQGMPGFMCVPRKPTPKGLELHTLCDAESGFLCWFEVYEGKKAMAKAEFSGGGRQAHVAQVLRMAKPYFGKVSHAYRMTLTGQAIDILIRPWFDSHDLRTRL